jgi:hypothetical protein
MPLEIKFLMGGIALTVVMGFILIPILRRAMKEDTMKEDEERNSRS